MSMPVGIVRVRIMPAQTWIAMRILMPMVLIVCMHRRHFLGHGGPHKNSHWNREQE